MASSLEFDAYLSFNTRIYDVITKDPVVMANEFVAVKLITAQTWKEVLAGKNSEEQVRKIHSEVAVSLSKDGGLLEKLIDILKTRNEIKIAQELNQNLALMRSTVVSRTSPSAAKYYAAEDSQHVELPDGQQLHSAAPYRVRLLLVGKTEVGKSAIYNRYATDSYNDKETATFGIVTYKKHLTIIGKTVEVELVDTAGREGFSLPKHFRWEMTHGALLVYDISNASSFDKIKTMPDSLRQGLPPNAIIVLVGNKTDLGQRDVPKSDVKKFAKKQDLCWFEVSAKTGEKVDKMFEECIKMVLHKIDTGKLNTFYNPEKELPPSK